MIGLLPSILILFDGGLLTCLWLSPLSVRFLQDSIAIVIPLIVLVVILVVFFLILKKIRDITFNILSRRDDSDVEKQFRRGLSFIALSVFILFYITLLTALIIVSGESGASGEYNNIGDSTKTSEIINSVMTSPTDIISTSITILGGVVIFFFFYGILGKNPNIEINTDKKELLYYYTYEYVTLIGILLIFFSLIFCFNINYSNGSIFLLLENLRTGVILQYVLVIGGFILLWRLTRFSITYSVLIGDYSQIERINDFFMKSSFSESGKLIKWWNGFIQSQFKGGNILSSYVLIIIITVAYLSYYFNLNIVSLLFFEIVLLFYHLTISRISHIPRRRYTIYLQHGGRLDNVYILKDQSDSIVVLRPQNIQVKVFKSTIKSIYESRGISTGGVTFKT